MQGVGATPAGSIPSGRRAPSVESIGPGSGRISGAARRPRSLLLRVLSPTTLGWDPVPRCSDRP
eukprot:14665596-Alexandrium_andersonii.AAC.1